MFSIKNIVRNAMDAALWKAVLVGIGAVLLIAGLIALFK